MKKTVLKAAGILAATVLLFASCAADDSSYSSQIDTVLYLEKPQVSAKAYPGMNFVSWEPVANANGYVLYKYEDNNFKSSSSLSYTDLSYKDTDIKDGALYSYFVEAESKTSTGRSISTENTRSDKVSVKGIVPPSDVTTLNLYAYEDYGSKESPKGNKDFVVTSSNIKISKDELKESEKLSISFPGKAYLTYNLGYTTIDNQFDVQNPYIIASNIRDNSTNDKIFYYGYTVTAPGIYKAVIRVNSENSLFGSSPVVISDESVTIEKLNGTGGTISSASYTDLGKTVRVVFNKYVLNGSSVPESYYKVYRCEAGSYLYEPVSGTIAATDSSKATYFADDTVPDSTKQYEYRVVVTDGNSIAYDSETVSPYSLAAQLKTTVSGVKSSEDNDAVLNDITWTITLPSNDVVITGVYALEKSTNYTGTVVAADFDRTSSLETTSGTDTTGTKFYVYTKNHTAGNKVYLLVTTSQENKKDGEWLSSAAVTTSINPISAPEISVAAYDSTITAATPYYTEKVKDDVIVNVTDILTDDDISNYTYTLYKTKSTVELDTTSITWNFTTSNWEKVTDLTMSKNAVIDSNPVNYVGIYKESDLSDGVYGYKVVKTRKDSGESVSEIEYVQIDCDSVTIKSTIAANSASFESPASATSNVNVVYTISKTPDEVRGKVLATDNLVINWIGLPETDVVYELYRTETTKNLTEVVWTKVELTPSITDTKTPMEISYDNSGVVDTKNIDVVTSQKYTYKDTGLSTGKSYQYMLVARKGTKQKSKSSAKVLGAN